MKTSRIRSLLVMSCLLVMAGCSDPTGNSSENQKTDKSVVIAWRTLSENNTITRFEVHRRGSSEDNWQTVGAVEAAGGIKTAHSYELADEEVSSEASSLTYRLVQHGDSSQVLGERTVSMRNKP